MGAETGTAAGPEVARRSEVPRVGTDWVETWGPLPRVRNELKVVGE